MKRMRMVALAAGAAVLAGLAGAAAQQQRPPAQQRAAGADRTVEHPIAEFSGLDKITGRIIKFEVRIGETVQFGALQVTPRSCIQRLTGDQQNIGFVEVDEITLRNEIRRLFSGWMFASSPGLNAVEHPIYDVWLESCKGGNLPATAQGPAAGYQGEGEPAALDPAAQRRARPAAPRAAPPQQQQQQRERPPAIQPGVPFDPSQLPRR
jgi:hypothetical protein